MAANAVARSAAAQERLRQALGQALAAPEVAIVAAAGAVGARRELLRDLGRGLVVGALDLDAR